MATRDKTVSVYQALQAAENVCPRFKGVCWGNRKMFDFFTPFPWSYLLYFFRLSVFCLCCRIFDSISKRARYGKSSTPTLCSASKARAEEPTHMLAGDRQASPETYDTAPLVCMTIWWLALELRGFLHNCWAPSTAVHVVPPQLGEAPSKELGLFHPEHWDSL